MVFANGHNHSTFSDGVYTPEELACLARSEGYKGIILTDHDTVQGTYFMQKAARKEGLLSLLGCEFTTTGFGEEFHLLGFDFNPDAPAMQGIVNYGAIKQRKRTQLLLEWALEKGDLQGITWEEVEKAYPYNDYICNNHVFQVMVAKGVMKEEDYFTSFIKNFSHKDVEREARIEEITKMPLLHVKDVIKAILKADGVPVLAHPHAQVKYIDDLLSMGLRGIEINHPIVEQDERVILRDIAEKRSLYVTGGTDHNGVLGGFEHLSDIHKCDPNLNGITEENFMKLYQRKLG